MQDMVPYFILSAPDSEQLMGDGYESIRNRQKLPCPITTKHFDGRRDPPDARLFIKMDHNFRDEMIIWWLFGCVIHERLLEEFEEQGFTGYQVKPATVRFLDGYTSSEYREFIVTGWAGMASTESGIRLEKDCSACQWKHYSGFTDAENLIDWNQWTGEDFFILWPLPNYRLVTERVAQWLKNRKVRSFKLIRFRDLDPFVTKFGFSPGRLSNYLPEDLAIKYGGPLGLE